MLQFFTSRSLRAASCIAMPVTLGVFASAILVSCGNSSSSAGFLNYRFQPEQSEMQLKLALNQAETRSGKNDPAVLPSLEALADYYLYKGRFGDAAPLFERALAVRTADSVDRARDLAGQAQCIAERDRERAETMFQTALSIERANHDATNEKWMLSAFAQFYERNDQFGKAVPIRQEQLTMLEATHQPRMDCLLALARDEQRLGRTAEAERHYSDAVADSEKLYGNDYTETVHYIDALAQYYMHQKNYPQAEKLFNQCFSEAAKDNIGSDGYASRSPRLEATLQQPVLSYASLLQKTGRAAEIPGLFERYMKLVASRCPTKLTTALGSLADKDTELHRYEEANKLLEQQLDLNSRWPGSEKEDPSLVLEKIAANYIAMKKMDKADSAITRLMAAKRSGGEKADDRTYLITRASEYRDNHDYAMADYLTARAQRIGTASQAHK